jgi:hypothetical protein
MMKILIAEIDKTRVPTPTTAAENQLTIQTHARKQPLIAQNSQEISDPMVKRDKARLTTRMMMIVTVQKDENRVTPPIIARENQLIMQPKVRKQALVVRNRAENLDLTIERDARLTPLMTAAENQVTIEARAKTQILDIKNRRENRLETNRRVTQRGT